MQTYFAPGNYNVICDRCGFKVKASDTKMEWNGLRVCRRHWEPRHPQEFVRGRTDKQSVPNPRPEGRDLFLKPGDVTADNFNVTGTPDTTPAGNTTWDGGNTVWDFGVSGGPTTWD